MQDARRRRRTPGGMEASAGHMDDLARQLLRRGVGSAVATRQPCHACQRTPLVGERVHLYEGDRLLCELCRRRQPEDPVRTEPVRGAEWGHAVRLRAHPAAA